MIANLAVRIRTRGIYAWVELLDGAGGAPIAQSRPLGRDDLAGFRRAVNAALADVELNFDRPATLGDYLGELVPPPR